MTAFLPHELKKSLGNSQLNLSPWSAERIRSADLTISSAVVAHPPLAQRSFTAHSNPQGSDAGMTYSGSEYTSVTHSLRKTGVLGADHSEVPHLLIDRIWQTTSSPVRRLKGLALK